MRPVSTSAAPRVKPVGADAEVRAIRSPLLRWFSAQARDLPWRGSRDLSSGRSAALRTRRDPYRVWIAEVMLQQTRVEAVMAPYARFLRTFPSLASLAAADEADVLAAWSGLGFYRRARLLHAGARHLVRENAGLFPESRVALRSVPGIGDYTCGAILSLAFGRREAAVDANVQRVLARLLGLRNAREAVAKRRIEAFAARLVDCGSPGNVNEALMDLGSAVCTQRIARCTQCPLSACCAAFAAGDPLAFALPKTRKAPRDVRLACAVLRSARGVLLARRNVDDNLLAGLWDFPSVEAASADDERTELEREVATKVGKKVGLRGPTAMVRHDIVGRRIVAAVYEADLPRGLEKRFRKDVRMFDEEGRMAIALPALPVKILRALSPE
jgi:A/G-specific adenine glycosylase